MIDFNALISANKAASALEMPLRTFFYRVKIGAFQPAMQVGGRNFYDIEQLKRIVFIDKRFRRSK